MFGLGTLINTATVLVGGSVGLIIGDRIPDRIRTIVVQVIGLRAMPIMMKLFLNGSGSLVPSCQMRM